MSFILRNNFDTGQTGNYTVENSGLHGGNDAFSAVDVFQNPGLYSPSPETVTGSHLTSRTGHTLLSYPNPLPRRAGGVRWDFAPQTGDVFTRFYMTPGKNTLPLWISDSNGNGVAYLDTREFYPYGRGIIQIVVENGAGYAAGSVDYYGATDLVRIEARVRITGVPGTSEIEAKLFLDKDGITSDDTISVTGYTFTTPGTTALGSLTLGPAVVSQGTNMTSDWFFDQFVVAEGYGWIGPVKLTAPNLTSVTTGIDTATLNWDPPGDDGGYAITGYKIYRRETGWPPTIFDVSDPNITTYIDTTAECNHTYTYDVSAINAFGEGDLSTSISEYVIPYTAGTEPDWSSAPNVNDSVLDGCIRWYRQPSPYLTDINAGDGPLIISNITVAGNAGNPAAFQFYGNNDQGVPVKTITNSIFDGLEHVVIDRNGPYDYSPIVAHHNLLNLTGAPFVDQNGVPADGPQPVVDDQGSNAMSDPIFTDPDNGDYSIQPNSPAHKAGDRNYSPPDDIEGKKR